MAKTQIKNYVFRPGLGAAGNLRPNAYDLLERNKNFIIEETVAWIQSQITSGANGFVGYTYNADKCRRDIGYVFDAILTDLRYGGNENTRNTVRYYWDNGVSQLDGDRQPEIQSYEFIKNLINNYILENDQYDALNETASQVIDTDLEIESSTTTVITDLFDIVIRTIRGSQLLVKPDGSILAAPSDAAIDDALAIVILQMAVGVTDTLDNNLRDLLAIDPSTGLPTSGASSPRYPNSYANVSRSGATGAFDALNVARYNLVGAAETETATDFIRDTLLPYLASNGYRIENDLNLIESVPSGVGTIKVQGRYDPEDLLLITNVTKNEIIYNFSNPLTGGSISFKTDTIIADTDFPKYDQTTDAITTLTLNYDTSNHNASDELQIFVEKTENGKSITTTRPHDFGTDAIERSRMAAPLSMLDADFEYGLQPTKWAAIGTLRGYPSIYEIPGTDTEVLNVTTDASFGNTTKIFDISMTNNGNTDYTVNTGTDRLGSLAGNDPVITITEGDTINLTVTTPDNANYNTYIKTAATTGTGDQVPGVTNQGTRNGGTISWTTSLGDAGTYFYQAQGFAAMSGTITVVAADPSIGVGQSKITVTTVGPHGVLAGNPITIKALEDSVVGASRAEGSFVVVDTPSSNTLEYYAKAKVGTVPGTTIATSYTQLRQAGFYTGASIGNPSFEVVSNGTSGTLTMELGVASGATILPFDGTSPDIGAPLRGNPAVPSDAQISSVIDTSDGGGEYLTVEVDGDYNGGAIQFNVTDATGVVTGLALDRGNGIATYVTGVVGNTIQLSDALTNPITGNETDYISVSGTNVQTTGSEVSANISRSAGNYTISSFNDAGTGYVVGDRLFVPGTSLGGLSPTHDLEILVDSVVSDGSIDTFTLEGTAFDGNGSVSNIVPNVNGGQGSGQLFDISFTDNVYTVTLNASDLSVNFIANDRIIITGDNIPNGSTPANDVIVKVSTVDGTGSITALTATGTAPNANVTYTNPTYTGGSGTGAQFSVNRIGSNYNVTVIPGNAGSGYIPTEIITISGTELGGASPLNDLSITIDNVDGVGGITDISISGIAVNTDTVTDVAGTLLVGSGFDLSVNIAAGSYSLDQINTAGINYATGQTFLISGNLLIGQSPANDLTVEVTSVNASGGITGVTLIGTAASGVASYSQIIPTNLQPAGTGARFDITRDQGTYTSIVINLAGSNYKVGNRILIPGTSLGGISPLNDIVIRITGESGGQISNFATTFTEAAVGNIVRLFSTVTISEPLTSGLTKGATIDYAELATIELTFPNAHGLVPGDTFISTVSSGTNVNNHDLAAGSFIVTDIPSLTKLRYQARSEGTIDASVNEIDGTVYPRPDSFFIHRPFDGGVQLGTGGPQHGAQAIRQSKKYIRYQSGKGIMYTTGALFAPSYDLRSVTAEDVEVNSLITVVTDDNDHGLQIGGIVRLLGIETPGYNSGPETATPPQFDYEVVEIVNERTFKIRAQRRLGATTAILGFGAQMSVVSWHGATVRSGIFDDQNGIFWEYDGTQVNVVQRTGTRQLAGTLAIQVDNNLVTGTNTRFRDQLKAGDRIIIKGMTHVVSHVNSQTSMTVTPDWRGVVDITGAKANLIVDKRVKQSEFNLDKLDGTGPSGYNMDIAKMQMIGIQYSWYGAGFIDFMVRGADGNFIFAHRMRNSNVNTEAFMRSGNLPVRYEVTNEGPGSKLARAINSTETTLPLEDTSFFPDSGTIYIDNEIIRFTGNNKTTNSLTGCTRGATFSNFQAGATRSYTAGAAAAHDARTGVILISQTITPLISHWGSAFITDGGFDEDRGYIFSYSETDINVTTSKQTAFLIRLAPSVSNAIVGDLGERELLNRAQLLLQSLELTADSGTGGIVVEGILNPRNYPENPNSVTWTGLSGVAQGGQPSFAQIAAGGGIVWNTAGTSTNNSSAVLGQVTAAFPLYYAEFVDPSGPNNAYRVALEDGDEDWYMPNSLFDDSGLEVGDTYVSDTGPGSFPAGTFIKEIRRSIDGSGLTRFRMSQKYTGGTISSTPGGVDEFGQDSGQTITLRKQQTLTSYVRTNFLNYTKASFDTAIAAGVGQGTPVSASDTSWPAGTRINRIELKSFGLTGSNTEWYRVDFSNTSRGTINPAANTTFDLTPANYAEPGETIFSFIAQPGERATVDFSALKELTNTPLGGRGTYPNGPDVLAVNVYKVSGNPIVSNVILRWGEAQA